jgi:phosphonoacetaldehyde hydrolase
MRSSYCGNLKAVILDWAGTTVDYGCQAPVVVLKEIFFGHGVEIGSAEARRDMGLLKKDHIRSILSQVRVAQAWAQRHGSPPSEEVVERLFAEFAPDRIGRLAEYSGVIPGVMAAVTAMRERGLRIGSTTGYTRPMLEVILAKAAAEGYSPDASVTPDEAGAGRPAPWMCLENLKRLNVFPPAACVKIGDTPADIQEGLNAGMWAIGVVDSGNEVGLSLAEWDGLDGGEKNRLRAIAREKLLKSGAQYVVNSLAEIGETLDEIERAPGSAAARAL